MDIEQIPTSNYWKDANNPKWIIVHGTAGGSSAQGVAQDFRNSQGTNNPKSTHYVIGRDGHIVQCVQEKDAAWGNGVLEPGHDSWWTINPNLQTISIEHVKPDSENQTPLTDAQRDASFALIRDICDRWGIPKRKADGKGGITGHFSISPLDRKNCPGVYPWTDLFNYLSGDDMLQLTDPFAKSYFDASKSTNDRWHCKNGNDIAYGILGCYRRTNGALRLPISGEQYDIKDVVYQAFEGGFIVYDPKKVLGGGPAGFGDTYVLMLSSALGQKLLGITDLKAQIAQLQGSGGPDLTKVKSDLAAAQASLADAVSVLGAK